MSRRTIVAIGLGLIGLALAWHNRFIQDDAFISFQYARQLAEGQGLTWFGTRVEGYSNFAWVLWIAAGIKAGIDPIVWAHVGSLTCFIALIFAFWRLSGRVFDTLWPRAVAGLLLVTNFTVSAYATGGLETMLQTALLCVATWQLYELRAGAPHTAVRLVGVSVALAVAVLAHSDSALPAAIIGTWSLVELRRRRAGYGACLAGLGPFVLLIGAWVAWKVAYYGDVLPNTYYAKVGFGWPALANGGLYLVRFATAYLIWPFLLGGAFACFVRRCPVRRDMGPILFLLASWCAYVIAVGGDFMEFRFLVPVTPHLFLLLVYLIEKPCRTVAPIAPPAVLAASCVVLTAASYWHATHFTDITPDRTLDSIPQLSTFYTLCPDGDWGRLGRALRRDLGDADVTIACTGVGAIPYYSRLKTVDLLGLNDSDVARHGWRAHPDYRRPGHQVFATLQQLRDKRVHLVVGYPPLVPPGELKRAGARQWAAQFVRQIVHPDDKWSGRATVVAMPLDERHAHLMWYLTPHPRIDQLIASGRWDSLSVFVTPP